MSDIEQTRRTVLAGLADPEQGEESFAERLAFAMSQLGPDVFDGNEKRLWEVVVRYGALTGSPVPPSLVETVLSRSQMIGESEETLALYRELMAVEMPRPAFRLAVVRLAEMHREEKLTGVLAAGLRALSAPVEIAPGKTIYGIDDALGFVRDGLTAVERAAESTTREGPVASETRAIARSYRAAREGTLVTGITTGFRSLDNLTGGLGPGELALFAGFTGEGKSKAVYNVANHVAHELNKNVLFATLEADRDQVIRNIIVRRSHQFGPALGLGQTRGIDYTRMKRGRLTPDEEDQLQRTLSDLESPEHGILHVSSLPYRATIDSLRSLATRLARNWRPDLIIVDYLGLMGSTTRRPQRREELDDLLVATKRLAVEGVGHGPVPILSPWQVSREAWQVASESGSYSLRALAETAQAERSSDLVVTFLRNRQDSADRTVATQVLKYRDGPSDLTFRMEAEFNTCLLVEREAAAAGSMDRWFTA